MTGSPPKEPSGLAPLPGREPWEAAIGGQVLWAWRLVNHQGYGDGLQLAFCERDRGVKAVIIQLLGEASCIEVFRVSRVQ